MKRAALVLALAATVLVPPAGVLRAPDTTATTVRAEHRVPRRYLFPVIGALIVGAMTSAYYIISPNQETGHLCESATCVGAFSIGGGALIGFMIGKEYDQLHALRYRGGTPLNPRTVSASAGNAPIVLDARDSMVAVGGASGVRMFASGPVALRDIGRRATGVRAITAVALVPGAPSVAIGSDAGFYLYPRMAGPGTLLREGSTTAAVATSQRVYFALGRRVEAVPVGADTLRSWPGVELAQNVQSLAWDEPRSLLWAGTDSALVALRPAGDSLEVVSTIAIGAPVRRIAVGAQRVALALGESGVRVFDVASPAAAREVARWTSARFAYDVSFAANRLYVAAGVDGVYVLDANTNAFTTLGLARELGFAVALASYGGYTYVLDRTTDSLRRLASDF